MLRFSLVCICRCFFFGVSASFRCARLPGKNLANYFSYSFISYIILFLGRQILYPEAGSCQVSRTSSSLCALYHKYPITSIMCPGGTYGAIRGAPDVDGAHAGSDAGGGIRETTTPRAAPPGSANFSLASTYSRGGRSITLRFGLRSDHAPINFRFTPYERTHGARLHTRRTHTSP